MAPKRSRWAWRLGSIAGIPIRVHATLLLLIAWLAAANWLAGIGPRASVAGLIVVVAVFAIIVVHELAHALVARRFGVGTRDILLLPIGGIASLQHIPERPSQELAIALAGPAVNVVLAGALAGLALAVGAPLDPALARSLPEDVLAQLVWINVVLAAFNLLPAFPLDGGRVVRALLATWMNRERATDIAAAIGKVLAVVLGVIGVLASLWLVVIALVIWFGASQESQLVHVRASLAGVPALRVMSRRPVVVEASATTGEAAARMVDAGVRVLPVIDHGVLVGAVTRDDLAEALRTTGPGVEVAEAPRHDVVRITPSTPLDEVLDELTAQPDAIAVVVDGDQAIGLVTPEQLASYVALHPAPA